MEGLEELLARLATSVDEWRTAYDRAHDVLARRIDAQEQDTAALRDELHGSVVALSNRIEANSGSRSE